MDKRELLVNPTLACGNVLNYKHDLDILEESGNRILHLDVMDGHYVSNLCFDIPTIRRIHEAYPFLLDVHLMVTDPESYIEPLRQAGAEYVSFHLDATSFHIRLLRMIGKCGMKGGVALNPSQPVSCLSELLPEVDMVLVMGVEPGFSGQSFLPGTLEKIRQLDQIRRDQGYPWLIEVDGGIDDENGRLCIEAGADVLVSGAFGVFKGENGLKEDYESVRSRLMQVD